MIDYIAFFLVTFITVIVVLNCYNKFINVKSKFPLMLLIILFVGSLVPTILLYFNNAFLKNIFTLIFFIIVFKYSSKRNLKETIYYGMLIWLYGLLMDFVVMIIISVSGLSSLFNNINIIYVKAISSVVLLVLIYLFCTNKKIIKFTNSTVDKLVKVKYSHMLEFAFLILLVILNVVCVININKVNIINLTAVIVVLFLSLMYQIINKKYNIKKLKELNNILVKNNEFFVKVDADYRVLKHNLTSKLLGIKTSANSRTKELIDDLIESYNSNFVSSQDMQKIPAGINGIIYEKLYSFNKKDINLAIDNNLKGSIIDSLKPRTFNNMCETLGVLIDNALEAAYESEEKLIFIEFAEIKDSIIININNTFSNEVDLEKLGEKDYSTKGKNHGIGLFSIFRKNDIKLKTKIINNLYQTELKIKKAI